MAAAMLCRRGTPRGTAEANSEVCFRLLLAERISNVLNHLSSSHACHIPWLLAGQCWANCAHWCKLCIQGHALYPRPCWLCVRPAHGPVTVFRIIGGRGAHHLGPVHLSIGSESTHADVDGYKEVESFIQAGGAKSSASSSCSCQSQPIEVFLLTRTIHQLTIQAVTEISWIPGDQAFRHQGFQGSRDSYLAIEPFIMLTSKVSMTSSCIACVNRPRRCSSTVRASMKCRSIE